MCVANARATKLYWADRRAPFGSDPTNIIRADYDGSNQVSIAQVVQSAPADQVNGFAIDEFQGEVYWSEYLRGIRRASWNGTAAEDFLVGNGSQVSAIDPIGRRIYYGASGAFVFSNLDGLGGGVFDSQSQQNRPFALDLHRHTAYWAGEADENGRIPIRRSNLDGTESEVIADEYRGGLAIAIDPIRGHLYWGGFIEESYAIRRYDLNGNNPRTILSLPDDLSSLNVDYRAGKLYWIGGPASRQLWTANLDGSNAQSLADAGTQPHRFQIKFDYSPYVTGIEVGGLAWPSEDYRVPLGSSDQLKPAPWFGTNQITLEFSEPVNIAAQTAVLTDDAGRNYALFGPVGGLLPDGSGYQARWLVPSALDRGRYTMQLRDGVITDNGGNIFDGEWADGLSVTSGDGYDGGEFVFRFNVLPGDVNQDGRVTVLDGSEIVNLIGQRVGDPGYSLLHDVDNSGVIDVADARTAMTRAFDTLDGPRTATSPAVAAVPEPATCVLACAALLFAIGAAKIRCRPRS
jgi:hypothetical protein